MLVYFVRGLDGQGLRSSSDCLSATAKHKGTTRTPSCRLYEVQQQSVSSLRAPSHSSAAGSGFAQAMQHSAEQDDAARYRTPSQAGHSSPAELEDADCVVDAAGASLTAVRLIGRDADLSRLETCARSGGMRVMVLRGPQVSYSTRIRCSHVRLQLLYVTTVQCGPV